MIHNTDFNSSCFFCNTSSADYPASSPDLSTLRVSLDERIFVDEKDLLADLLLPNMAPTNIQSTPVTTITTTTTTLAYLTPLRRSSQNLTAGESCRVLLYADRAWHDQRFSRSIPSCSASTCLLSTCWDEDTATTSASSNTLVGGGRAALFVQVQRMPCDAHIRWSFEAPPLARPISFNFALDAYLAALSLLPPSSP